MTETISPAEGRTDESPRVAGAIADHETLIALHEMARQQLDILNSQDRVLAMLDNLASKDMPGRQAHIQDCVDQILAKVDPKPAAS